MQVTMNKEALLQKLRERLKAAETEDAKKEKAHKADEQKALVAFRKLLREAMTWPYDRAKKANHYGSESITVTAPSCPRRDAFPIAEVLKMVEYSTAKTFTVKSDTDVHRALSWMPESERVGTTVCD